MLADPLPENPLPLAAHWLAEAWRLREQPNPNAMVLATCDARGRPSARVVLCKDIDADLGLVRFVSNYQSRKGRELTANPQAALVFHWDSLQRQLRMEGRIRLALAEDSDSYFASRPRASQIGAHASAQSQPIGSMIALAEKFAAAEREFAGREVPRPQHWGGYELSIDVVEFWVEGAARLHERARWEKQTDGRWHHSRLQP